ncbi:MAG: hypothetical protein WCN98_13570 [Verrucomicrobiaceae bacterium]
MKRFVLPLVSFAPCFTQADVRLNLPAIFSDNMVLQQKQPHVIRGWEVLHSDSSVISVGFCFQQSKTTVS